MQLFTFWYFIFHMLDLKMNCTWHLYSFVCACFMCRFMLAHVWSFCLFTLVPEESPSPCMWPGKGHEASRSPSPCLFSMIAASPGSRRRNTGMMPCLQNDEIGHDSTCSNRIYDGHENEQSLLPTNQRSPTPPSSAGCGVTPTSLTGNDLIPEAPNTVVATCTSGSDRSLQHSIVQSPIRSYRSPNYSSQHPSNVAPALCGSENGSHSDSLHDLSSFHLNHLNSLSGMSLHMSGCAANQALVDANQDELPVLVSSSDLQDEGLASFHAYIPFSKPSDSSSCSSCSYASFSLAADNVSVQGEMYHSSGSTGWSKRGSDSEDSCYSGKHIQ